MALMLGKLFAALRAGGVEEKAAQEAAEEAADADAKVAELKTSFADVRSDVRVVQAGTALLGVIVIGLLWQTVNLTGTVNRLDERMIGFDKRLGAVETRLAGIETTLGEIRVGLGQLRSSGALDPSLLEPPTDHGAKGPPPPER